MQARPGVRSEMPAAPRALPATTTALPGPREQSLHLSSPQVQPVALISEAHAQQQCSKSEKTDDPVALAQRARVEQKYLEYRNRQQHKSLPAQPSRLAAEPRAQQQPPCQQEPCGVAEPLRHAAIGCQGVVDLRARRSRQ